MVLKTEFDPGFPFGPEPGPTPAPPPPTVIGYVVAETGKPVGLLKGCPGAQVGEQ
jgi:hypothetical protein